MNIPRNIQNRMREAPPVGFNYGTSSYNVVKSIKSIMEFTNKYKNVYKEILKFILKNTYSEKEVYLKWQYYYRIQQWESKKYSKKRKLITRDNKKILNRRERYASNRNKTRIPSQKRSWNTWKNFIMLFPKYVDKVPKKFSDKKLVIKIKNENL